MARDLTGNGVDGTEPEACEWCLEGALDRALFLLAGADRDAEWSNAFDRLWVRIWYACGGSPEANEGPHPWEWNDDKDRTQADVVAVVREAGRAA